MNLNKLKPAWKQYQWMNGQIPITEEEVLTLIASPKSHKLRSITVNVLMLLTLLLVCY